jgi:hypothetical protein
MRRSAATENSKTDVPWIMSNHAWGAQVGHRREVVTCDSDDSDLPDLYEFQAPVSDRSSRSMKSAEEVVLGKRTQRSPTMNLKSLCHDPKFIS